MPPVHSGVPDSGWDEELRHHGGHFLQSAQWLRVQAALGYPTVWSAGDGWGWTGAISDRRGVGYLYLPHGPTLWGDTLAPALDAARVAGAERSLAFVRLEPLGEVDPAQLLGAGARAAPAVQPVHTWILDLDADEAQLRAGLSAGHRGSINAAGRRGLSFRQSRDEPDISVFLTLMHRLAGAGRFHPQADRYYRTILETLMPTGAATLHIAEADGEPVAAAIGFDFGDTRYYAHAASDPASRRLSPAAPLVWSMILDSRERGQRHLDFWGVAPAPGPGHPWSGLSQFKRSFGGRLVTRSGTWELPLRPWRYRGYRALRRLAERRSGRSE